MFMVITVAYLIFWGPLFMVTLVNWNWEFEEVSWMMKKFSFEVLASEILDGKIKLLSLS